MAKVIQVVSAPKPMKLKLYRVTGQGGVRRKRKGGNRVGRRGRGDGEGAGEC